MPLRTIDVPDPIDPPRGCSFHTRCPEDREACPKAEPELLDVEGVSEHSAACFRMDDEHAYWDSEALE
jgi:peptide/nickel transport system ATP-binding protein